MPHGHRRNRSLDVRAVSPRGRHSRLSRTRSLSPPRRLPQISTSLKSKKSSTKDASSPKDGDLGVFDGFTNPRAVERARRRSTTSRRIDSQHGELFSRSKPPKRGTRRLRDALTDSINEKGEFDVDALLGRAEESGQVPLAEKHPPAYFSTAQLRDGELDDRFDKFRSLDNLEGKRVSVHKFLRRMEALSPSEWKLNEKQQQHISLMHETYNDRLSERIGATLKPELHVDAVNRSTARAARQQSRYSRHGYVGGRSSLHDFDGADGHLDHGSGCGLDGSTHGGAEHVSPTKYPADVSSFLGSVRAELGKVSLRKQLRRERSRSPLQSPQHSRSPSASPTHMSSIVSQSTTLPALADADQTEQELRKLFGHVQETDASVAQPSQVKPEHAHGSTRRPHRKSPKNSKPQAASMVAMMRAKKKFLRQKPAAMYSKFCKTHGLVAKCQSLISRMHAQLSQGRLSIAKQLLGNEQANAIVQSCMHSSFGGIIDSMDLSGNDIHDSMLSSIVEKWGSSLREIDLALNHCGLCAVDAVGTVLQSPGCKLTELNLSHAHLTHEHIEHLAEGLAYNDSLERLNLARNDIDDRSAETLSTAFATQDNCALQELDLSWNAMITSTALFLALPSLTILDVSMNNIGSNDSAFEQFSSALKFNQTLLHINITHCRMSLRQCQLLAEDLKYNHALLGIHIEHFHNGFTVVIDSRGFMIIHRTANAQKSREAKVRDVLHVNEQAHLTPAVTSDEEQSDEELEFAVDFDNDDAPTNGTDAMATASPKLNLTLKLPTTPQGHQSAEEASPRRSCGSQKSITEWPDVTDEDHVGSHNMDVPWLDLPRAQIRTNTESASCWLCGRWIEQCIYWDNKFKLPVKHVFVHLQCDQFEPQELFATPSPIAGVTRYCVHRVLPPGRHYFYFSWTDEDLSDALSGHGHAPDFESEIFHQLVSMDLPSDVVDKELVVRNLTEDAIRQIQQRKAREEIRRKRKRHIQLNSNVGRLAGEATPGFMDFDFDDPTGDYSNFAAALKAAKEAYPSDEENEDTQESQSESESSDSDSSDEEGKMEVNYVDIHCRLISEGFVCGERLHAFRLPLQPTAKPRCSGESEPELPPPSIFSVETSIFAPRKHEVDSGDYFDNSKVFSRCLWQDWKLSNVRALLNSDETSSAMKKAIWAAGYKELVRIFQSVTAVDHDWKAGGIFLMKFSTFREWASRCGLTDGRISKDQLNLIFVAVNAGHAEEATTSKRNNNALRFLTRYEFLNALVRVAMARSPTQFAIDPCTCVEEMIRTCVIPRMQKETTNLDDFRRSELYTPVIDDFFKVHDKRLRKIFKKLSVKRLGDDTYGRVEYSEWVALCAPLLRVGFPETNLKLAFMQSFLCVINHQTSARYAALTYLDFLEALARLAYSMSTKDALRLFTFRADKKKDTHGKTLSEISKDIKDESGSKPDQLASLNNLFAKAAPAAARKDMQDVLARLRGAQNPELVDKLDVLISCYLYELRMSGDLLRH